ncbi:malic enzyme, NAD binding domain protein [Oesophagostomum dentatum]|uniref:Malic enzyme n=1 Tax=Oesophagostomum dentatum TaxID=61180 RepID=A0A0B1SXI8_OESDE|nr:malic enzyme, NAD binding domain protein [Oesophagostomum dentatum]
MQFCLIKRTSASDTPMPSLIGRYCSITFRHVRSTSTVVTRFSHEKQEDSNDSKKAELQKLYRIEKTTPEKRGCSLLNAPRLNKGMGFTKKERHFLGIRGLIPPAVMSPEQQVEHTLQRIRDEPDDLKKYIILDDLQDRNAKLFYRVLSENVREMMPIVYTPTVGQACQKGIYITIDDNDLSEIYKILNHWPESNVQAIVVTDGERILGLGDLGVYGMGIPVGKLSLYVALAGVQPHWCLPVVLDVGTNNKKLLEDPFYIGQRHERVRGEKYLELVDNFMKAATKRFGRDTLIQFEDFASHNAFALLDRYRNEYCTFNDDIQGTAAIGLAGLMASTRITKKKLSEQKIVFFGAGSAGIGIAEMCVLQMMEEGISQEDARANIFFLNSKGLITKESAKNLSHRHKHFAKDLPHIKGLLDVIKMVKPNMLLGLSTVHGAFTPEILREMAKINDRPVVFALSNPTNKAECTAEEAYRHTDGAVLFASGSPFPDVELNGKIYKPGQGNNSYIFPGVALGSILFKAKRIPDQIFLIAARVCAFSNFLFRILSANLQRCANFVAEESLHEQAELYPKLEDIRELSVKIALDIGNFLYDNNLSTLHPKPEDMELFIRQQVYSNEYDPMIEDAYDGPE